MPFVFKANETFEAHQTLQIADQQKKRALELQKHKDYSDYSKAFIKNSPFRDKACDALKAQKHKVCHTEYVLDCDLVDNHQTLKKKEKGKEYCLDLRMLELESDCFPKNSPKRKGHEEFKETEQGRYDKCAQYVLIPYQERLRIDREQKEEQERQRVMKQAREKAREKARRESKRLEQKRTLESQANAPAVPAGPRQKVYVIRK
jgi:hypothetical protein